MSKTRTIRFFNRTLTTVIGLATMSLAIGCNHPNTSLKPVSTGVLGASTSEEGDIDPAILAEIKREPGSTIQPGDELAISVYQDPRLDGTYRIDNDGGFQFHYAGRVKTDSLTTNDVRKNLIEVTKDFLKDPSVTVNYLSQQPRHFRILGEVKNQGRSPLSRNMRLIDGIAAAGGLNEEANRQEIILIRSVSPTEIRAGIFNYREATLNPLGGAWADNIILEPGDTIFVPRSGKAQWESALRFVNLLADTAVGLERTIVLYPDVESIISTGEAGGRNTIVVR